MSEVGYIAPAANPLVDPFAAVRQSVIANNQWSAEQAQKQMDFQREMSDTAHQREVADLKAAGLNPVLSARLGGASTPSGASATADTSGTSSLVSLIEMALETANTAAGAASAAVSSGGRNSARDVDGAESSDSGKRGQYSDVDYDSPPSEDLVAITDVSKPFINALISFLPTRFRTIARPLVSVITDPDKLSIAVRNLHSAEQAQQRSDTMNDAYMDYPGINPDAFNISDSDEWNGAPGYGSHGRRGHH